MRPPPSTLTATEESMCEVRGKQSQRHQQLQLHRRGHKLPWKQWQPGGRTRVYICLVLSDEQQGVEARQRTTSAYQRPSGLVRGQRRSRRDEPNAAATMARAWMSVGTSELKTAGVSAPPEMQIAAASLFNPTGELPNAVFRPHADAPGSVGLQQSEKNRFSSQSLWQPVHTVPEELCLQNSRSNVFSQHRLSHIESRVREGLPTQLIKTATATRETRTSHRLV